MAKNLNDSAFNTATNVLIATMDAVDDAEAAITVIAHADGRVEIRWSKMRDWQVRGLLSAGFDLLNEELDGEDDGG